MTQDVEIIKVVEYIAGEGDKVHAVNYADMVHYLAKPGQDIINSLDSGQAHLLHMVMGVCGEAGELLDALKKHIIYGKQLDMSNVIEELGDIEFYLQGIRNELMISRTTCLVSNARKLVVGKNARYKAGTYSDRAAQAREDKQ